MKLTIAPSADVTSEWSYVSVVVRSMACTGAALRLLLQLTN